MNQILNAIQNCKNPVDHEQALNFAAYIVFVRGGEKVRNQPDGFYGRGIAELLN